MKLFGRRAKPPDRDSDVISPPDLTTAGPPAAETLHPLSQAGFSRLRESVVVYSNFRAGSHLLQSSLATLTALHDVDEVFARKSTDPASFNAYLNSGAADAAGLLAEPERHLPSYFGHLFDHVPGTDPLIISLKYTQAHRLGADDLSNAPSILKLLAEYRVPVLHLIRRDVVQQAMSHLVASETGRFHAGDAAANDGNQKIWLDPAEVATLARSRAEEQRRARAHLEAVSARHLTVYYEELAPAGLADELRRALRFLDRYAHVPDRFKSSTAPMGSNDRVANRAEILDHLIGAAPELLHSLSV
jgi:LPS sulfotransferase NodH